MTVTGIGRWSRRPAATPPQIVIAMVVSAALTAACSMYLMKSYAEQVTRDMTVALHELNIPEQQRDACTLSYASMSASPHRPAAPVRFHFPKAI